MARFDADREYAELGFPNTVAFLKAECNLGTAAAMEVLSVARQLHRLPQVEAAAEGGVIGFQQAAVIAESAERLGAESLLPHQPRLLAKAEELDPGRLRLEVKQVEIEVDADRVKRETEWLYRSRRLFVNTMRDGRVRLDGILDPEGGAVLKTALGAAMGPRTKDESRSEEQRRADGLVDLAKRALEGREFGQTGCQRPHLNVVVDLDGGSAAIERLGPIAKETIDRLLCDCALSVNGSQERRTFSAPLRRSLAGRHRHCQWPGGCDRPAEWCDGHHLHHVAHGGKTIIANGVLLCGFHHRLVHEGGWQLVREGDQLVTVSPGGEKFRSAKAPPAA